MTFTSIFQVFNFAYTGKEDCSLLKGIFLPAGQKNAFIHRWYCQAFWDKYGNHELEGLQNLYHFCILENWEVAKAKTGAKTPRKVLGALAGLTTHIINCLWFVKDNSCFSPTGFIELGGFDELESVRRNVYIFNASGNCATQSFDKSEMERAMGFYDQLSKVLSAKYRQFPKDAPKADRFMEIGLLNYQQDNFNRVERAYNMLVFARTNSLLTQRISFLVAALECLFSISREMVTEQTTIRPTAYLGGNEDTRKANFKVFDKAYDIRSRFFHGSQPPKGARTGKGLQEFSNVFEGLVREIFIKILDNPEPFLINKTEILKEWFDENLGAIPDKQGSASSE